MLEIIYLFYFLLGVICLGLYSHSTLAHYIGFGLSVILSLVAALFFILNINNTYGFALGGNFLFNPKFTITPLEGFFSFIVSFIAFSTGIYSLGYAKTLSKKVNLAIFTSMYNFFIFSMLLVISSSNVFSFIVLWEFMTLISALLLKIDDTKSSNRTVMIYLGIAQIGAFCILAGLLMLSYFANSVEFSNWINLDLPFLYNSIIFILLFIGFASKFGAFPFHVWLPMAHCLAPTNISAFLSAVMTKIALFGLIKFCLTMPISPYFGLAIMIFGGLSILFGILQAIIQNEYKRIIAYSTVENIGIIMLGIGAAFYGIGSENSALIILGFIGAFYHILNHSIFKSLLFFGAGSIYNATKTKYITKLGGLATKMPFTAFFFLIATLSISALPPLNGFMSEWYIYKSMLIGGISNEFFSRLIFSLCIVALALSGALVVYVFVRMFGVIFAGVPRDENIFNEACEKSFFMPFGMFILSITCIFLGLYANSIIEMLGNIVLFMMNASGLNISIQTLFMPLIAILLCLLFIFPFLLFILFGANRSKTKLTPPWACGFKYDPRMQMNASSFIGDLRKIVTRFTSIKSEFKEKDYFSKIDYKISIKDIWWEILYEPVVKFSMKIADKIGIFQNGRCNFYIIYILLYLCAMLVIGFYVLGT